MKLHHYLIIKWEKSFCVCGVMSYAVLVQKGAVCQCWLSWVKQVRPGMLQVSLLRRRFRSFLSFFLRFCSFISHCFLSLEVILLRLKGKWLYYQLLDFNISDNALMCLPVNDRWWMKTYLTECIRPDLSFNSALLLYWYL